MLKTRFVLLFVIFLCCIQLCAQSDLPTDYLTPAFHAGRRAALREKMPANSVLAVFAYPTRNFSNDIDYFYHPSPDMYYFSGYKEPHSVLLIFKDEQQTADGSTYNEMIFVQKRNALAEQWTGHRLGTEGVKAKLGLKMVFNGEEFKNLAIDFSKFDKIIFDRFPIDVPNNLRDSADLYDLYQEFKLKANIPTDYSKDSRFDNRLYRELTGSLREIKTDEEMVLLRKAVEISCMAHNEAMKAVKPNMSELELQGLQEYVHKKYGAEGVGYGSIVGAGENGCVLHYMENSKTKIGNSMVLMDVGAEYHGYTADVTRTIPAKGKFSPEEKIIYQLVYDAQEAAFKILKDGAKWSDASNAAKETIAEGLLKLGIIKEKKDVGKYYPHGLSHHIGLDVHDRGVSNIFKKGMVITIEPGIYINSGSDCDKKWWGIAVRIEDDALITKDSYELLSVFSPRKPDDVEKMTALKTAIDDFNLPPLKSTQKKAF
ncbi:MAG TPA: aminopeptidase P family protein [Chitinophagaceae bacterium]|jgi:Xaa-Pro aminopeptidase|nr:aminopeptidase P family protein [Chitinophagaceae bacterium]